MNGDKPYKYVQGPEPRKGAGLILAFQTQDRYEN